MPPTLAALFGAAVALLAVGLVLFFRWQVARRRRALEAAQGPQLHHTVEAVIDEVPAGVAVIGPHDELLAHNDAAVRIGAIRGTRVGFKRLHDKVREVRQTGERFDGEVVREPVPGRQATLQLHCRIACMDDDMVLLVAFDDAHARRVEAVRRDFVANISHELKTPIGAIGVLAEAVEAAKDDPAAVERFAGRLQTETGRLAELVRQIIDLSRLQAADPLLEKESVDVAEVVAEAIRRCRERAEKRHVNILNVHPTDTRVLGDQWQLTDAVTNLIQNAINYSDEGARVAISIVDATENGEEFVDVKVSDNGIGIKPEDQERIFERFYRVDYGRSRSSGGTGLGLSIVRHIAQAHGGSIKVWSIPGQGSTFTLRFPAYHPRVEHRKEVP